MPTGSAGFAFNRVLRGGSAYYLLGAFVAKDEERDGRPRELRRSTCIAGASFCAAGQWVVIPAKA